MAEDVFEKYSINVSGYLDVAVKKLIKKESFRTRTSIVNEALDMYLRSKGIIGDTTDEAEK